MLTTSAKKHLVETTILPLFDYGDVIYKNARKGVLDQLDLFYHAAIRLITNAPYRTHHCELYSLLNWTSLHTRRETHWYIFIYKVLLGLLPEYLQKLLKPHSNTYTTRS